jgi:hypothetical protein
MLARRLLGNASLGGSGTSKGPTLPTVEFVLNSHEESVNQTDTPRVEEDIGSMNSLSDIDLDRQRRCNADAARTEQNQRAVARQGQ